MKPAGLMLLLIATLLLRAQQPSTAPTNSGLHAVLTTAGGATTFPIGARIRLVLRVSASIDHRFASTFTGTERSGCGDTSIEMSPDRGWHDPLAALHRTQMNASVACGTGYGWLRARPVTETFELNQCVRFDRPGTYTVVIRDPDITQPSGGSLLAAEGQHLVVWSNPLTLHLVAPPPGWRTAQLQRARSELEAALAQHADRRLNDAVETLASLGGARAGRLLAQLCRRPSCNRDALAEAEAPAAVLAELQQLLGDPELPLNQALLSEITQFTMLARGDSGHDWRAVNDATVAAVMVLMRYKRAAALGPSLAAILSIDAGAIPEADRGWLTDALADHFDEMTDEQRVQCLWALNDPRDPLAGPSELALVRHAATMTLAGPFAGMAQAGALHRWYDLAPAEARPAVVAAILDARAGAHALGFLPDKTLPQADAILLNDLGAPQFTVRGVAAVSLIARYASPAIAGAVALALNAHGSDWSCPRRHGLVEYLLRVRPALAAPAVQLGEQPVAAGGCGWARPERHR